MKGYSSERYEFLFTEQGGELTEEAIEALRHRWVYRYRTKTIKAGDVLECEIYPIWATRNEVRKAKERVTPEAQRNLNDKNARKKLTRRINANFTADDLHVTLTYKGKVPDSAQARRDIQNYIRRVKRYREKNGLPEMKYVYVIEFQTPEGRKKVRVHHHIIMSGMDRNVAEKLWGKGTANADRLQPDEYGLEGLARYITKAPNGGKRWCCSKNLKEPRITTADTRVSKRMIERIAVDMRESAAAIFQRQYQGYEYLDCEVRVPAENTNLAGVYVYARMRRKPPGGGSG